MAQPSDIKDDRTADLVQRYHKDGYVLIESFLDEKRVSKLAAHYEKNYTSLSSAELQQRHAAVGDQRYMITAAIKGPLNSPELYANETLMPVMSELLGNHFIISSFGSVIAFPGADAQSVHFDYPPLYQDEAVCAALPPHAVTLVVPLVNITPETGSTALWPGTHTRVGSRALLEQLVQENSFEGSVCLYPKLGDAFLMDFRLIHAGTANRSEIARPILYIVYSRPWFREDMNFPEQPPINISPKQLRKVPKDLRYLFTAAS